MTSVALREGVRVIDVPMRREINLLFDIQSLIILIALFIKERPYIVHTNTPKASLLSMIAAWITKGTKSYLYRNWFKVRNNHWDIALCTYDYGKNYMLVCNESDT